MTVLVGWRASGRCLPTDEEARASAEAREQAALAEAEVERRKAEAAQAALGAERALRATLEAEIAALRAGQGKPRSRRR